MFSQSELPLAEARLPNRDCGRRTVDAHTDEVVVMLSMMALNLPSGTQSTLLLPITEGVEIRRELNLISGNHGT